MHRPGKRVHIFRKRHKALGVPELIAIALGGMVGGGIFTILGISVAMVGAWTPIAIALGGGVASLAAYSYVKLGVYYKDEGATYSFFKRTFPGSHFAASVIGWWVTFGYISTLALYAYTFASYAISEFSFADDIWVRKFVAGGIIAVFAIINVWSVKGMGKIEDLMVYTKLVVLAVISFVLINHAHTTLPVLFESGPHPTLLSIMIVASVTFVAYEGFQLVIHAVNEMEQPAKNIPRSIYSAIALAISIYVIISVGAILAIPLADIVRDKEYALAAGARDILGPWGADVVILGALLATMSAISGTVFGASRMVAVIAKDGYFPAFLGHRSRSIPIRAILMMSGLAFGLILIGNLRMIVEFGSITFLVVSLLMAYANFKIRRATSSSTIMTVFAMGALALAAILIFYYEFTTQPAQMTFILGLYVLLTLGSWGYSIYHKRQLRAD